MYWENTIHELRDQKHRKRLSKFSNKIYAIIHAYLCLRRGHYQFQFFLFILVPKYTLIE